MLALGALMWCTWMISQWCSPLASLPGVLLHHPCHCAHIKACYKYYLLFYHDSITKSGWGSILLGFGFASLSS